MKRVLLLATLLIGPANAEAPLLLSPTGLGDVQVGWDIDRLGRQLHDKLPYNPYLNRGCGIVTAKQQEAYGITYMIEDKILTRINVDYYGTDPRPLEIKTEAGVGLGSSEEDLAKAYAGKMRVEKNPGDPSWHTIYVDTPDQTHAVVFETDGKKVKSMRAGLYPAVSYPDGCN